MVDELLVTELGGALRVHAVRVGILGFVDDHAALFPFLYQVTAGEV